MIYLVLWVLTIMGGAILNNIVPDSFSYLLGFVAGTFSLMFLQLGRRK